MDIVDVKNQELASVLQPLLREWIEVITSYSSHRADDELYWYNEQASVSTLAAAAARLHWHVLAEFTIERGLDSRASGAAKGRADLWFEVPSQQRRESFLIEAKQRWLPLAHGDSGLNHYVTDDLDSAFGQLRRVKDAEGHRLGAVFIVPKLAVSLSPSEPTDLREPLHTFLSGLQRLDVDA